MPNIRIGRTYADGVVNIGGTTKTISDATAVASFDETFADPVTNEEIDLAFTLAKVKSCGIECSQDATLYTNHASTGTPDKTITLHARVPIIWDPADPASNPFGSVDVAKFYFTCATAAARLQIGVGLDLSV